MTVLFASVLECVDRSWTLCFSISWILKLNFLMHCWASVNWASSLRSLLSLRWHLGHVDTDDSVAGPGFCSTPPITRVAKTAAQSNATSSPDHTRTACPFATRKTRRCPHGRDKSPSRNPWPFTWPRGAAPKRVLTRRLPCRGLTPMNGEGDRNGMIRAL